MDFKRVGANMQKSSGQGPSRLGSPLLTPWAPGSVCWAPRLCQHCLHAPGIPVPFWSYLEANDFFLKVWAASALYCQHGDAIPCLVLSLGRLWCTKHGLNCLCLNEVLTPLILTVLVTSFWSFLLLLLCSSAPAVATSAPVASYFSGISSLLHFTPQKFTTQSKPSPPAVLKTQGICMCIAPGLRLILFDQLRARGRKVLNWGSSMSAVKKRCV